MYEELFGVSVEALDPQMKQIRVIMQNSASRNAAQPPEVLAAQVNTEQLSTRPIESLSIDKHARGVNTKVRAYQNKFIASLARNASADAQSGMLEPSSAEHR